MKKLLLILLFIPLLSFSQSYKDLMSINSVDMFKKAVIENGYEFSSEKDGDITYGFNIIRDSIDGDKSIKWAYYNTNNDRWTFSFSRSNMLNSFASSLLGTSTEETPNSPYDTIVEEIKEKCKYYKIQNINGIDFVTYSCSESTYKGKIGFAINDGSGIILQRQPNE
jgi:hypothetical protein